MTEPSETSDRARKRPPPKVSEPMVRQAALGYLERYATSAGHLTRLLLVKVGRSARFHGTEPEDGRLLVERVVAKLVATGLLDDRAYAAAMTRTWRRRGASAKAVRAKLAAKGVAAELAEEALAALREEEGDSDLAAAVAYVRRRRLGPFRSVERRAASQDRDLAALARAGFSYDLARKVIEAAEPADLDELLDAGRGQ